MMYLLRKYDVARFTRNDAMFASMCRRHTSLAKRHHWQSQHHLPKANIIEKALAFASAFSYGVRYGVRTHDLQGHNLTR